MKRDNFGKLVEKLRLERTDYDTGFPWTRKKLAQVTGGLISENILYKLETGKQVKLNQDRLVALANAFQLSTAERREFINAANGVDTALLISEENTLDLVLRHCLDVIKTIHMPAFVIDSFYDIIAGNMAFIYLFNLQQMNYINWRNDPYPKNVLLSLLNPEIIKPGSVIGRNQREMLIRNVMNFRIRTLPHRYKPYFEDLLRRFYRVNTVFEALWIETQRIEDDIFLGLPFTVLTKEWGPLRVMGATMRFPTEIGNLEIIIENPADEHTRDTYPDLIRKAGQDAFILSQWPKTPPYPVDKKQG